MMNMYLSEAYIFYDYLVLLIIYRSKCAIKRGFFSIFFRKPIRSIQQGSDNNRYVCQVLWCWQLANLVYVSASYKGITSE